jgi:hypothetical protein
MAQLQPCPNDFQREHLPIRDCGHQATLPQPLAYGDHHQVIVNQTKTCDNTLVQVHNASPELVGNGFENSKRYEFFFANYSLHIGSDI